MAKRKGPTICTLTAFERRLYCYKKRASKECLKPWFLGYRCPNLEWSKADVIKEARKGVNQIVARSGFTEDAIQYAERHRPELRLKHGIITVKPRRRKKAVHAVA